MKRLVFITLGFLLLSLQLEAQDTLACNPDSTFIASGAIVDPAPYVNDTLGEGLPAACLITPYDLTIFVHPPATFSSGPVTIPIDSFRIDSVVNLPEGLAYSCSTDDCTFAADSINCIYLSGTPTSENTEEVYELTIYLTVLTAAGFPIPATFPDPTLAPGTYSIAIFPEGSPECQTVPTLDFKTSSEWMSLYPNPVQERLRIDLDLAQSTNSILKIWNQNGALVKQVSLSDPGAEDISVQDLPAGFYIATVQSDQGLYRAKFIKD